MPLRGGELDDTTNVRQDRQDIEYRKKMLKEQGPRRTNPLQRNRVVASWDADKKYLERFWLSGFSIAIGLHRRPEFARWARLFSNRTVPV